MATERYGGAPLWTAAVAALLLYGIIAFLSWQGQHEANAIIAVTEKYKQTHGHLPSCDCDLGIGIEEHHAFYLKKSDTRVTSSTSEPSA